MMKSDESNSTRSNLLLPGTRRWTNDRETPIVRLSNVHKSFDGTAVLKGIDLPVKTGAITVILGASGSGKSVLLKHMCGLVRPDSGSVQLFGKDLRTMDNDELTNIRKRIGTMFQNYALFDSMSVVENVAFSLYENGAMSSRDAQDKAGEILTELGLESAMHQYPSTLSGGMKKRVSFARAIVTIPELVLYDEPTTGLDPVMREFVDDMILEITKKYQLTGVMISHDLATIFRLADYLAVLHDGKIIAYGPPDEIQQSDDPRIRELIISPSKQETAVVSATDEHAEESQRLIVKVQHLEKSFGSTHVLKGVDFNAAEHQLTVLIGGSGSGKSVLMKHILGLLKPDSGVVEVFGEDITKFRERELRQLRTRIGMLFQHAALFDSLSVRDNIAFPLIERRVMNRQQAHARVDELMEKLKISTIANAHPIDISSGQQKRVSLARTLASEPKLIIYDEPTTGQDPIMSQYVEDMIVEVQESFDITAIMISHDMTSAFRIADSIAMLHHGKIIVQGTPQVVANCEDERVKEFIFAAELSRQRRNVSS